MPQRHISKRSSEDERKGEDTLDTHRRACIKSGGRRRGQVAAPRSTEASVTSGDIEAEAAGAILGRDNRTNAD